MIRQYLKEFNKISLSQMDNVSLMRRIDTKYLLTQNDLLKILPSLKEDYKILEINGNRLMSYATLYFDSVLKNCFIDHHNGKSNRFKVRIRNYIESNLSFLEIKRKNNLGITKKERQEIESFQDYFSNKSIKFIQKNKIDPKKLEPTLYNNFKRLTLVNKCSAERVTIDLNLSYKIENEEKKFDKIVIIEVKQDPKLKQTKINKLLKSNSILPTNFSKYCIGVTNVFSDVKKNRFKELNLKLNKLNI